MTTARSGSEGRYRIPVSAAHAWVEVYFPSYGWIEFEPTPILNVFDYTPAEEPTARSSRTGTPGSRALSLRSFAASAAGIALVVGAGLGLVAILHRRREWQRIGHDRQLPALYWRMRRALAESADSNGLASLTPAEFAASNAVWLVDFPRLGNTAAHMTCLYVLATYSPRLSRPEDVYSAQHAWRMAWWERLRLKWLRSIRALGLHRRVE